jgi:hypothetical protein
MSLDPEFLQLSGLLRDWQARRRLCESLIWMPRGLLVGLLTSVAVATAARLRPFLHNEGLAYLTLALSLAGLLGSLILITVRRDTLAQQARFADRLLHLQERLSTAVEIRDRRISTTPIFAEKQLADALKKANSADFKARLPLRLVFRDWLVIALAALLLALAVMLPNPQSTALKKRQAVAESIKNQIQALESLEEEISSNTQLSDAERDLLLEPIQDALAELGSGDLNQESAVATLSEAEADLRRLAEQFANDDLRQALRDAGQPLAENSVSQPLGEALQNGNLSAAGAAASQLADVLADLNENEQAALAEDLAQTAAALQGVDDELADELSYAAQAIQEGDIASAQQALRNASDTLQQRAQEAAAAQQADAAAGQVSQGRQEVAQAGQPGQGQSDQQDQGQGQGTGSAEGQGAGSGQSQGQGTGQGVQTDQGEGTGGPGPGGGHAENVFVPDFVDLSSGEGVDIELPAECLANPAECGGLLNETPTEFSDQGSSVPYSQVFSDYQDAAYEALSDDYIPLGLKSFVRDYFSSLEP